MRCVFYKEDVWRHSSRSGGLSTTTVAQSSGKCFFVAKLEEVGCSCDGGPLFSGWICDSVHGEKSIDGP